MSPEFGSTCAIFPIDAETIRYMAFTGRSKEQCEIVEAYAREQGLWHDENSEEPTYSETLELDLGDVVPSLAGPKRPQDRVSLTEAKAAFRLALETILPDAEDEAEADEPGVPGHGTSGDTDVDEESEGSFPASDPPSHNGHGTGTDGSEPTHGGTGGLQVAEREEHHVDLTLEDGTETELDHGHVVIAAITSCTNTSNPTVMIAAGLLAKNARRARAGVQAVGEDVARSGLEGRHGVLRQGGPRRLPRVARLPPRRLRLHDLHRQLRPAAGGGLQRRPGRGPRGGERALAATATSRAGSTRT